MKVETSKANIADLPAGDIEQWGNQVSLATRKETKDQDKPKVSEEQKQAEALGIEWTRPKGDNRSAKYIIENSKLLSGLGNQEGIKDKLKERVGDFDTDSDAAYRAEQVLEHIEKFDSKGERIAGKHVGNGRIDGITPNGDVRHNTEAGRLKDFGKYGFKHLKGDLGNISEQSKTEKAKEQAKELGIEWERPKGDDRSAKAILEDTPLLKNLKNQSGVKDMLKERVGDFEKDADAAYRAKQVLEHVERFDGDGKEQVGKKVGNDTIDDFTGSGEARPNSEAGRLQDFGKYGFESLKGKLSSPGKAGTDEKAKEKAEALGIQWERQESDKRSAKDIIQDSKVLSELDNESGTRDMLKDRVGDFERDADAAYRAVQVLEHIERFDGDGKQIVGGKVGDGDIDGFSSSKEARNNTEAGRLQNFGKNGFDSLKGAIVNRHAIGKDESARQEAEELGIKWEREDGDKRSAQEILDGSPLLRDLKNESGSSYMLKDRVGDFEADADAAYRAEQVLAHIEMFDGSGKQVSDRHTGNDKIDGFTGDKEARNNTEAGRLQDLGKHGFKSLNGELPDSGKAGENKDARKKAEALGIEWERPKGDDRSARDIIHESPLLRDLGNQQGVKDRLKDQVGDFDKDADAAYRAAQVLEHIETFNSKGKSQAKSDKFGNEQIDGFKAEGTIEDRDNEANRLRDFGLEGFDSLKGEFKDRPQIVKDQRHEDSGPVKDEDKAREQAKEAGIKWERPKGDDRSAGDIIKQTPVLSGLGDQSDVKKMLKERVGDFEKDANAAYRAAQVLQHIERFDGEGKQRVGKEVGDGIVNGFTKSGEAHHNTEAGRLQDFGKYGFENLKGKLPDRDSVKDDKQARERAEALGIEWERPDGDDRTARDIIAESSLLRDLGNESGTRDMFKDRVGDYETDADAAYRAKQVLERIEQFDGKGKRVTGDSVGNNDIDGFSDSKEARPNTEAGRLQDFGKNGFESLVGEPTKLKGYADKNKDADEASNKIVEYASLLHENFGEIKKATGAKDFLRVDDLKEFKEKTPDLSDEFKEALDFWTNPGSFAKLETSVDKARYSADGLLTKEDITHWIDNSAPKDAKSALAFVLDAADGSSVYGVDTQKFDNEIFKNPEKYSPKERAAVLRDLQEAHDLVTMGESSGMFEQSHVRKKIEDRAGVVGTPDEVRAEIESRMEALSKDPEVAEFMNDASANVLKNLVGDNKGLKKALSQAYDDEVKSGNFLKDVWPDGSGKDKAGSQTEALAQFSQLGKGYQAALGVDKPEELRSAIEKSGHAKDLQKTYTDSLVSGKRMEELLKDNSAEAAMSAFSMETALYNSMLDPEFTKKYDDKLNENFTGFAKDNLFKDATFEDLKKAYGVNGGDELDEQKVREMIGDILKEEPALLTSSDGTPAKADQILTVFRGNWDMLRQGTKTLDKLDLFDVGNSGAKHATDKGILHGVSGLFLAGITIGKGVNGTLNDRNKVDLAIGSVQTASILAEGGLKNYRSHLKDIGVDAKQSDVFIQKNAARFEEAAKGLGGVAGVALGAYSIFDGVQMIRNGDKVGGIMNLVSGSIGTMAGMASAVEGGMGVAGMVVPRFIPVLAGGLGLAAAAVGAVGLFVTVAIQQSQQSSRENDYADLLGEHLEKYKIDGKP